MDGHSFPLKVQVNPILLYMFEVVLSEEEFVLP